MTVTTNQRQPTQVPPTWPSTQVEVTSTIDNGIGDLGSQTKMTRTDQEGSRGTQT